MQAIDLSTYQNIVILTGAGVSVASGLPTYRGEGGLWNDPHTAWVSDGANLPGSLNDVWKFYGARRDKVTSVRPNAAHLAIAALQNHHAEKNITLVTQNVDGLHQAAGSENVLELHGSVLRSRCTNEECALKPFEDLTPRSEAPPCPLCNSPLRPDIVLFNEELPPLASHLAKRALRDCDLFLAVGTSGTVSPASNFVRSAAYVGARTILVNLEPMNPRHPDFQEKILGRAEEVLPVLFGLS